MKYSRQPFFNMSITPMKTPQLIVYMIVGTVCVAFLSTTGACVYAVVTGMDVEHSLVFMTLKSIIDTTLGAIVGFLANTRSAEVKDPNATTQTTVTTPASVGISAVGNPTADEVKPSVS